mmetsp:Transcript_30251/g.48535  ORF Transcript_30251/g.48535 Transcript_30251/m.48535 type:complete len:212 (+) Transcript_30251:278-913(+)
MQYIARDNREQLLFRLKWNTTSKRSISPSLVVILRYVSFHCPDHHRHTIKRLTSSSSSHYYYYYYYYYYCHLKGYLLRHMKRHDENAAQPCRYCSKTFRDRSNLIQHLETHRVGKYACTKCEKKFQFQKSLTIHTKLHDKNDNSTKCRICGNVFACEYNLRQHINELHYGFAKYSCDVCGKNFTRKWNRNKHFKKAHPSELFKAKLTGVIS